MNLPNRITLVRILLIPLVMFFYLADFIPYGKAIAIFLFVLAAYTDHLDGSIARKRNLVTDLGKFLDPIADKLLVSAALFLIICDGTIASPWGVIIATIIIGREFIVSALRMVAVRKGVVVAADFWGKLKTAVTDVALPLFMFVALANQYEFLGNTWLTVFTIISYVAMGIATLLTIMSGVNYIVKNKDVFKQD